MSLDKGLYANNYYDYESIELAIQNEHDIVQEIPSTDQSALYTDPIFPTSSHSLYFNPLYPPKGYIPGDMLHWHRISTKSGIERCTEPTYLCGDITSSMCVQGVLGDSYFINALRLLACRPEYIRSLLVSDRYANLGIYTFRFYKYGKWRYVVIDDYIPCHQSGKVYFSRNYNPNETFVMLLEKAYAKLHGCYEALNYGLTHKVLQELAPSPHARLLKSDLISLRTVCDDVWDFLEDGINRNRLVGCYRVREDPYGELSSVRQGITLGIMYHIVDVCIVKARPTVDLDGITVGMICLKNLQKGIGKFTGSWRYDHEYWTLYPEIGDSLKYRTMLIQHSRGLGPHPDDPVSKDVPVTPTNNIEPTILGDEAVNNSSAVDLFKNNTAKALKIIQPIADDLSWIQIEDFVDIFNRLVVFDDDSLHPNFKSLRFKGSWIPGINSFGAPLVNPNTEKLQSLEIQQKIGKISRRPFLAGPQVLQVTSQIRNSHTKYAFHGGITNEVKAVVSTNIRDDFVNDQSLEELHGVISKGASIKRQPSETKIISYQHQAIDFLDPIESENSQIRDMRRKSSYDDYYHIDNSMNPLSEQKLVYNKLFNQNPLYVFSVSEKCTVSITLYQTDRRWSCQRSNTNSALTVIPSHNSVFLSCMNYSKAIAFVVIRMPTKERHISKSRNLLEDIVARSDHAEYSSTSSAAVILPPGNYGVIPYQYTQSSEEIDFIVNFHFVEGYADVNAAVNSAINKPVVEDDDIEIASALKSNDSATLKVLPPTIIEQPQWEYAESGSEASMLSIYQEIASTTSSIASMKIEIDKLSAAIRDIKESKLVKNIPVVDVKEEKIDSKVLTPQKQRNRFRSPKNRRAFINSMPTNDVASIEKE